MFGSSVLEIVAGTIFIFLMLSVFASTINEIILSLMNLRGKELLRGVATLLDDAAHSGLVDKVYNHGQVYGLYQGLFDPKKGGNLPSYIPARNFALALLDSVTDAPFSKVQSSAQPALAGGTATPTAVAREVVVLTQEFKDAAQRLADNPTTAKVGKPLVSMIAMAGNDAERLQKSVEDWYNSGMDRVSGWYKYRTQKTLFVIGLVIAGAVNADTIHIVKQISQDSTLRASILAAAEKAKDPSVKTVDASQAAGAQAAGTQEQYQAAAKSDLQQKVEAASHALDNVNNVGVPLGWHPIVPTFGGVSSMLLGWLLTAIAISLGAPFWFDILNKIMVIRSTVKPTEKSKDESSKD